MASKPSFSKGNLNTARKILLDVTSLLDESKILYHLEGGTLLGLVRDRDLLPWDNDLDISVPQTQVPDLLKLRRKLFLKGYHFTQRFSKINNGPVRVGDICLIKLKPIIPYLIRWLIPNYNSGFVPLDIFIKVSDGAFTYWQAQGKMMRVDKKFYESFESISFLGHSLNTPAHFREYLTKKYGDWSIQVKEWNCSEDELTIIK